MNTIFLTLVLSQPAPVPPPPQVPAMVEEKSFPTYADAYAQAQKTGKPIVLYVGTKPFEHDWAHSAYEETFTRHNGEVETDAIFVIRSGRGRWLHRSMTAGELQREVNDLMAETEVRRAAPQQPEPFRQAAFVRSTRAANC
jgi:hypothetical protein